MSNMRINLDIYTTIIYSNVHYIIQIHVHEYIKVRYIKMLMTFS